MSEPCTCETCTNKQQRIHAYTAIRRAAAIAREHDERAAACITSITENVLTDRVQGDDYLVDVECSANNAWHHRSCALEIRTAIRTAIGSDKA